MNNQLKRRIKQIAILVGVVIIPLMYSFFYLNAFWDPYARLDDVAVAVVNLDEGAVINGESRNVGDEICDSLEEDGTVDFHFTDAYEAAEGLEGRPVAALRIPARPRQSRGQRKVHETVRTASPAVREFSQITARAAQRKEYATSAY